MTEFKEKTANYTIIAGDLSIISQEWIQQGKKSTENLNNTIN